MRLLITQLFDDGRVHSAPVANPNAIRIRGTAEVEIVSNIADVAELADTPLDRSAREHGWGVYRGEAMKLQGFKTYVHDRLDKAGVPADPNPEQTAKTGCRIEGRLDWVLNGRHYAALTKTCHEMIDASEGDRSGGDSLQTRLEAVLNALDTLRKRPCPVRHERIDELEKELSNVKVALYHRDGERTLMLETMDKANGGRIDHPVEALQALVASRDHAATMVTELTQDVAEEKRRTSDAKAHVTELERWLKSKDEEIARLRPRAQLADRCVELTRAMVIAGNSGPTVSVYDGGAMVPAITNTNAVYDLTKEDDRRAAHAAGVTLQFKHDSVREWTTVDHAHELHDVISGFSWRIAP